MLDAIPIAAVLVLAPVLVMFLLSVGAYVINKRKGGR